MVDCEFCDIVNKKASAEVIYETTDTLAFFPLEPATRGHTMVIPKRHIENFLELQPADIPELGQAVVHVAEFRYQLKRVETQHRQFVTNPYPSSPGFRSICPSPRHRIGTFLVRAGQSLQGVQAITTEGDLATSNGEVGAIA